MYFSLIVSFLMLLTQNLIMYNAKAGISNIPPVDSPSSSPETSRRYSSDFPGHGYIPPTNIPTQAIPQERVTLPLHASRTFISANQNLHTPSESSFENDVESNNPNR